MSTILALLVRVAPYTTRSQLLQRLKLPLSVTQPLDDAEKISADHRTEGVLRSNVDISANHPTTAYRKVDTFLRG